jgi:hypothetical protein
MPADVTLPAGHDDAIVVVTPMYNDWDSARIFLTELNAVASEISFPISVVIVNDGSVDSGGFDADFLEQLKALESVDMIELVANVGHARAIAIGLSYVATEKRGKAAAVIDCDGEDRPADLAHLVSAFSRDETTVFVADRAQRHETLSFRLLYRCYRGLFRLLTGRTMSFGNFSLIPWPVLTRIVYLPELWNHLAGSLMRSKFNLVKLPLARGRRYAGRSQMSVVSLIQHGLGSIAVDLNRVLVRTLVGLGVIILALVTAMSTVVFIRLVTGLAIPGWASTVFGLLTVLLVQLIVFSLLLLFVSLKNDTMTFTLPVRHYREYIDRVVPLRLVSQSLPRSAGGS